MTPPGLIIRPALQAFAKELRAARLNAEMSTQELAEMAEMTRQGIEKIEKGGCDVKLGTIVLLARALDCHVSDFFPRKSPWHD
ncbi:MAG TPA: helix-turn-helix transcriptional regulator [Vicinamibacterales bacterium]|nr:helix-turn-helix transcriptional regulator [Vicinamibacterales bacterium]